VNGSLKEFYLDLNPSNLLAQTDRSFGETIILFVYLLLFSLLIYRLIVFTVEKIRPATDTVHEYNRRRVLRASFIGICVIIYFPIIFSSLAFLPTMLGFAGAGIVISLKEYWLNIIGWMLILGSNGFKVGDRIDIDGVKGDVVNIGFLKFSLVEVSNDLKSEQSTNRLIHFPNYYIVNNKFFLVTDGMDFVWEEIRLNLDLNADWEKAEKICLEILNKEVNFTPEEIEEKIKEVSKNYLVRIGTTTPIVYTTLEPEGSILLSLRFLTPIRAKRTNRSLISREILKRFKDEPTIVFKR
jgi:small-conductance mechanosensitive channel